MFGDPFDDRYDPSEAYEPFDVFDPETDAPTHEVIFADDRSVAGYVYPGEHPSVGYAYAAATGREIIVRRV